MFDHIYYFCRWHLIILSNIWIWEYLSINITVGCTKLKRLTLAYNIQGSKNLRILLLLLCCEYYSFFFPHFSDQYFFPFQQKLLLISVTTNTVLMLGSCFMSHYSSNNTRNIHHHILHTLCLVNVTLYVW